MARASKGEKKQVNEDKAVGLFFVIAAISLAEVALMADAIFDAPDSRPAHNYEGKQEDE